VFDAGEVEARQRPIDQHPFCGDLDVRCRKVTGHLPVLAEMVVQGDLRVAIRRTYVLADAAEAQLDFANEHTLVKLVIATT
jgi:NADPH:quinone reductase-like Zn-dependent oxidoreductase